MPILQFIVKSPFELLEMRPSKIHVGHNDVAKYNLFTNWKEKFTLPVVQENLLQRLGALGQIDPSYIFSWASFLKMEESFEQY